MVPSYYLNTSNVNVNHTCSGVLGAEKLHLNTSNVNVNQFTTFISEFSIPHLNTSNVNVNLTVESTYRNSIAI